MAGFTMTSAAPQAPISGSLPFAQMGNNVSFPTDLGSLGSHYASAYNNALAMNSSNYSNILAGYQQTMAGQTSAQDAIKAGYTGLYNDVLGGLANQGQTQREQINRDYAAHLGQQSQQLIDRGLGNSTVQSSVARGLGLDQAFAGNALEEQVARQRADYASRLGLSGLDYANTANMQNTAQANNQLGWMNSVMSPYPDANMYSQLAQQYGMTAEAAKWRDQLTRNRYPGNPPAGSTLSGVYGTHFPTGFSGGEPGGGVQLGAGSGGGGGGFGNVAGGIGAYISPGQNLGFSDAVPRDYSGYGGAASSAAQAAYGAIPDYSGYGTAAYNAGLQGLGVDPYSGSYEQPASDYNLPYGDIG